MPYAKFKPVLGGYLMLLLLDLVFSQIHSTIIAGSGYLKQTESKDLWFWLFKNLKEPPGFAK